MKREEENLQKLKFENVSLVTEVDACKGEEDPLGHGVS